MLISDQIAELFDAMLAERDGILEIRRNEMAERLGCSPSQINYVIASRFSPERGYVTVSRRGGGGYIRIERKRFPDGKMTLMHAVLSVGPTVGAEDARILIRNLVEAEAISPDVGRVLSVAVSDAECEGRPDRDAVRARRLKKMLIALSD
ncbi:MAG: CtsR family transcriptional regulator [Clostridia bacterium]|nr:CtsR family transcriptional regulator [Clostridia bacterium]